MENVHVALLKDSEKESHVIHQHHDEESEQECAQRKASNAYKIAQKTRKSSVISSTGKVYYNTARLKIIIVEPKISKLTPYILQIAIGIHAVRIS